MSTKDGGQAFPGYDPVADKTIHGMTLRDWFAGQCIAGLDSGWTPHFDWNLESGDYGSFAWHSKAREMRAAYSYAQADAMLAERAK